MNITLMMIHNLNLLSLAIVLQHNPLANTPSLCWHHVVDNLLRVLVERAEFIEDVGVHRVDAGDAVHGDDAYAGRLVQYRRRVAAARRRVVHDARRQRRVLHPDLDIVRPVDADRRLHLVAIERSLDSDVAGDVVVLAGSTAIAGDEGAAAGGAERRGGCPAGRGAFPGLDLRPIRSVRRIQILA